MKQMSYPGAMSLWLEMVKNPSSRWAALAVPMLAGLYVLSPIDVIPDLIPILGWGDDFMVIFSTFVALMVWMRAQYAKFRSQQVPARIPVSDSGPQNVINV